MPDRSAIAKTTLLTAVVLVGITLAMSWPHAEAGSGATLTVTNLLDDTVSGNGCSLREAINNANNNVPTHPDCTAGNGPGDLIDFNVGTGTPLIPIGAPLPQITETVTIDGNAGPADRVELRGPGGPFMAGFNGLRVTALAPGSAILHMVINSFPVSGISVEAANVSVLGNLIGTDATGTVAMGNLVGISVIAGTGVQIGSATGTTPGGPCTGDCNLVSANSNGIEIDINTANAVVRGNFVGTNLAGTADIGNINTGIVTNTSMGLQIGGSGAGEGNLVSGNRGGILAHGAGAQVRGNRVGTTAAGDAALPNDIDGIEVRGANNALVEGNLASANGRHGIFLVQTSGAMVRNNLVGVAEDGVSPLGNTENGIWIATATDNTVGGPNQGDANIIAFNGGDGVRADASGAPTTGNTVRGNSIHDNGGLGINNKDGGNNELTPPVITAVGSASGTACPDCTIDVYSDAEDEGAVYHGSTAADSGGAWSFTGTIAGPNVTATATDASGNTSEFSLPFDATPPTPTPSPAPTASLTATASPTPTVTARPSATPTPTDHTSTPTAFLRQGDVNCDGEIDEDDMSLLLEFFAGLTGGQQSAPCPDVNEPEPISGFGWGDVNCDGTIDGLDALFVLLFRGGLETPEPEDPSCFPVGVLLA